MLILPHWPPDAVMQEIAARNALPETAFVVPAIGAGEDHAIRWFSPVAEVALCGHATLAAGHVMLTGDPGTAKVRFATHVSGVLTVARAGDGYAIRLPGIVPQPAPLPGIVAALGDPSPVATLWEPRGYAVIVLASEAEVAALAPDFGALATLGALTVIVTAAGEASDIVTRVFVPAFGVDEDSVTGSAYAVIAGWWGARLGRAAFTARQLSARGGALHCALEDGGVCLTGRCRTVAAGSQPQAG